MIVRILAIALALAIIGLGLQEVHIQRSIAQIATLRSGIERTRADGLQALSRQQAAFRAAEQQAANALQEIQHEHHKKLTSLRADRDRAADAAERLRHVLTAAASRAASPATHPAPSANSTPTCPSAGVLADVLGQCVSQLRAVADHADATHAAGQQCWDGWTAIVQAQPSTHDAQQRAD